MISNTRYSINETSKAWGISLETPANHLSLKNILENIIRISHSEVEVITPGPLKKSLMLITGKITRPVANGHLILNPNGIDLRIIPGKIKNVCYKNLSDNRYRISFKNQLDKSVLSISFTSEEVIAPSIQKVTSNQLKMRAFNRNQSLESLWRGMSDIHHFYPMLQQLGINKIDAFRSVPADLACQVDVSSLMTVLNHIHKNKDNFMVFIGNDAVIQVYIGPIKKIVDIKQIGKIVIHGITKEGNKSIIKIAKNDVGQIWVVNKSNGEGFITSLEVFDRDDNHIAQFYGYRKEEQKQNENWAKLMKSLPRI